MITSINEFKKISKPNILYHFTDWSAIMDITNQFLHKNPYLSFYEHEIYFDNIDNFVEIGVILTTPNVNLGEYAGPIRFTLDGNKLFKKYKLHYNSKIIGLIDDPIYFDASEYLILSKINNDKLFLKEYCIKIDINLKMDINMKINNNKKYINDIVLYFKNLGIPVFIVNKFT